MPGKRCQGQLQDDFARPLWQTLRGLGGFDAFEQAADIYQDAAELWPHRRNGPVHPVLGPDDTIAHDWRRRTAALLTARPAHVGPVRRDAGPERGESELSPQALTGLELVVVQHSPAIPVLAPPEPGERAFGLVHDGDG